MKFFKHVLLAASTLFLFSACDKEKEKKAAPKAEYYFSADIDGKAILFEQGNQYSAGAGSYNSGSSTGPWEENQMMTFSSFISMRVEVVVHKYFTLKPDCAQIESMFRLGSYPVYSTYSSTTTPEFTDGVGVAYTDENGVTWRSETGNQTGSTFEITEHHPHTFDNAKNLTTAVFSCKLYDGQGNMKVLKNGKIRSGSVNCDHL